MDNKNIFDQFKDRLGSDIEWEVIDNLVISDANILRPVKGHAFEILFDEVVETKLLGTVMEVGGDTDIDRELLINDKGEKHSLQIKTPAKSTIKSGVKFGVSLHKTHGQEKRPRNLYPIHWPCQSCGEEGHDGERFPAFLLVQHPEEGMLIVPREAIPENKNHPGHFADPAYFEWDSEWLNRWDLLGYPEFRGRTLERRSIPRQTKLPKIADEVCLTDEEIIRMWLKPENFRMIDMNLRGNLREPVLTDKLEYLGVETDEPTHSYPKYDRITKNGQIRIQIKGPSKNQTNMDRHIIGAEVMGTHGKGANRRYHEDDFDFFGFVIDPNVLDPSFGLPTNQYHFCLIPISALPLHYKNEEWETTGKIYEACRFKIEKDSRGVFLTPADNYKAPVSFRDQGPWYINEIPKEFH